MKRTVWILLCLLLLFSCTPTQTTAPESALPPSPSNVPQSSLTPPDPPPASTTKAPSPPVATQEEKEIRISFLAAGDNVIHPCIYKEAKTRATKDTREYNFKPTYEAIAELVKEADISFINQETLMGGEELGYSGYPRFNSPRDLAYDLQEMGFDVINVANNHMCDKGEKGLKNTVEFLSSLEGLTLLGGHLSYEDFQTIRITEHSGVRIAWLSYTYGTNGLSLPSKSELFVPYIDRDEIQKQITAAEGLADLTFVSVHWGDENKFKPNASQTSLAQFMADLGADAIIGHHPHVIQPIEWLEGTGGNRTLCIYSLGNLISAMNNGYNMLGGLFTFDIVKQGDRVYLDSPLFVPTAFYYADNWFSTKLYLLEDYSQKLSLTHGSRLRGGVASRERMEKYLLDVMDEEFLPAWLTDPNQGA